MTITTKIIIALVLILGGFSWYNYKIDKAYSEGKAEIQAKWDFREKQLTDIAKQEQEKQKAEQLAQEQIVKAKELQYENALKELDTKLVSSRNAIDRLRNAAVASPSRNRPPLDPGASCTAHDERIREIEFLLREGQQLVAEVGGLVGEGQQRVAEVTLKLTTLQQYVDEVVKPK
jgi:hypothetical protein